MGQHLSPHPLVKSKENERKGRRRKEGSFFVRLFFALKWKKKREKAPKYSERKRALNNRRKA